MSSPTPLSSCSQSVGACNEVKIALLCKLYSEVLTSCLKQYIHDFDNPSEYTLVAPLRYRPVCRHGGDLAPLYWHHLNYGLRLSLYSFLNKVFRALGVAPAQLTLNSIAILVEFLVIYQVDVRPTLGILGSVVSVKSGEKEEHFYLQAAGDFNWCPTLRRRTRSGGRSSSSSRVQTQSWLVPRDQRSRRGVFGWKGCRRRSCEGWRGSTLTKGHGIGGIYVTMSCSVLLTSFLSPPLKKICPAPRFSLLTSSQWRALTRVLLLCLEKAFVVTWRRRTCKFCNNILSLISLPGLAWVNPRHKPRGPIGGRKWSPGGIAGNSSFLRVRWLRVHLGRLWSRPGRPVGLWGRGGGEVVPEEEAEGETALVEEPTGNEAVGVGTKGAST